MFLSLILFIGCGYLSTTEANFVDDLQPCPSKDKTCAKDLMQKLVNQIVKNGIEELNVIPVESMVFKDIKVSSQNLVNITLVEGKISGLQSCVITDIDQQIEKGFSSISLYCDLVLEGKHRIVEASPVIQNLFGTGAKIHGEGNFKLNLKKLQMTFTIYYDVVDRNGQIYFKYHNDKIRYEFDVEGVKIDADNIFLGDKDSSSVMVEFMNNNWQMFKHSIGNDFFVTAVKIMEEILIQVLDKIPANNIVSDDLTPYIKK